jgi:hypothetical protein
MIKINGVEKSHMSVAAALKFQKRNPHIKVEIDGKVTGEVKPVKKKAVAQPVVTDEKVAETEKPKRTRKKRTSNK